MSEAANLEIAKRYLEALSSAGPPEELSEFFAPEVVQEEFPNQFAPRGATRDLKTLLEARAQGQAFLKSQRFELLGAIASGEQVALELRWHGVIRQDGGPFQAGQSLRARCAVFLEFRGGRIIRQRNYDCLEP
jgi:ketosteroid isomerase-like protein